MQRNCGPLWDLSMCCIPSRLYRALGVFIISLSTVTEINKSIFQNQAVGDSWPKIQFEGYDGEQVKISIAYPDTQQDQLYSFNLQTDHYKYVAASLVCVHLPDNCLHSRAGVADITASLGQYFCLYS